MRNTSTVRPVAIGLTVLLLSLAATSASASGFTSWQDYRNRFIKQHPLYLPLPPDAPLDGVSPAWVRALGRYFHARSRAIGRIRKAYFRALAAWAARTPGFTLPRSSIPAGAIRTAVEQAFGSEAEHAMAVLQCENPSLNPSAIHHDADGTSDWGLFQINIVYNRGYFDTAQHLLDPWYNIAVATGVYRDRGWGDWTCGRLLGLA